MGDFCDVSQTDKVNERDCGRRCSRQKGQSVIDKRNTRNEKNAQTQRERDKATDMDETREDGDDDAATSFRCPTEALRVLHSTSSSITQT